MSLPDDYRHGAAESLRAAAAAVEEGRDREAKDQLDRARDDWGAALAKEARADP